MRACTLVHMDGQTSRPSQGDETNFSGSIWTHFPKVKERRLVLHANAHKVVGNGKLLFLTVHPFLR